jgi:hypothetical protein
MSTGADDGAVVGVVSGVDVPGVGCDEDVAASGRVVVGSPAGEDPHAARTTATTRRRAFRPMLLGRRAVAGGSRGDALEALSRRSVEMLRDLFDRIW